MAIGSAFVAAAAAIVGNEQDRKNAKASARYQNRYALRQEQELWERGQERGLTPQEYYGSPVAGSASSHGGAQVLGNAPAQESFMNAVMGNKQMETQKEVAETQADAQRDVARIQAGATTRGQDINKEIAEANLELNRDQYNLNVKEVAKKMEVQDKEIELAINKIATSTKEFTLLMKQLSMGPDNMLVEYFQRHHGINLSDPKSFTALPKEKREQLLSAIIALKSKITPQAHFFEEKGESLLDALKRIFGAPLTHEPIEPTERKPVLGRTSEPYQSGPNMNYR